MPLKNKHIDWKNRLAEHPSNNQVWQQIEDALDFDVQINKRIPELPVYQPDRDLWNKIALSLPVEKAKSIYSFTRITSVAAAIALIILVENQFLSPETDNLRVESEIVPTNFNDNNLVHTAIAEISSYCNLNTPACNQPEFRQLMRFYDELSAEEFELKKAMRNLGDSPEMIKAMIKIENLKSETIQDMILLIQS